MTELQELEELEILGGGKERVVVQNGCTNTAAGCAGCEVQSACTNNSTGCACEKPKDDMDPATPPNP